VAPAIRSLRLKVTGNLSPEFKNKVTALLKSHPDYAKWNQAFPAGTPNLDLATYIFMRSSTWPDEIRRRGNRYDHPHWHYVDYPLKPPAFPLEPGPSPTDDVLYGFQQCENILSDTNTPVEERAVYLSWLIHLVGDVHQPLHCASLTNDAYPAGDEGGNSFYVRPASRGINLHSFWDGLLGTSGKSQAHINYAIQIESEHPRKSLPELTRARTPKDWSLESRGVAVEKAYLGGELKGSTSADTAPALPERYTTAAKAVAEKQAALAGYRLGHLLEAIVK
jgi:hypothetical protein